MPISNAIPQHNQGLDLFTSGNIDSTSALKIGDLVGTLGVGILTWTLIIGMFLIGVIKSSQYYYSKQQSPDLNGITTVKLLIKPLTYLMIGIMILAFISVILKYNYHVNLQNNLKFFFEARYDNLVGNLEVNPRNLKTAQTILFILDLASKAAVWSIPIVSLGIFLLFFSYILAIISTEKGTGGSNTPVFKLVMNSFATMFVASILITIFYTSINSYMFKSSPNIENLGTVISCSALNKQIIKKWVKEGLQTQ